MIRRALAGLLLVLAPGGCCTCPLEGDPWPTEEQHGQHAQAGPSGPSSTPGGVTGASTSGPSSSTASAAGAIAGGAATVATGNPLVGQVVGWATVVVLTAFGVGRRRRRPR